MGIKKKALCDRCGEENVSGSWYWCPTHGVDLCGDCVTVEGHFPPQHWCFKCRDNKPAMETNP